MILRADSHTPMRNTTKEVHVKHIVLVVALVVALVLLVAASAFAFDGYRDTYTNSSVCQACHGGPSGPLAVYNGWATTKHAEVGDPTLEQANALPIEDGPRCAGCHSGNYSPEKASPSPTVDPSTSATSYVYPYQNTPDITGDDAFSEPFIGCSACHYGAFKGIGNDPADTAHFVPYANMASADICGQCHSRYSKTVNSYPIATTSPGSATSLRPEYAVGFNPLGTATSTPAPWTPEALSSNLLVPMPDPTSTPAWQSQLYYKAPDGTVLPFTAKAHAGGATQYEDWLVGDGQKGPTGVAVESHGNALQTLKDEFGSAPFLNSCLECHSTDYRIIDEWNKERGLNPGDQNYRPLPTIQNAKFGITCQACHTTHDTGAPPTQGVWNEEFDTQLKAPAKQLCVECHNAELQDNPTPGVAVPGQAVHHPMKEMMNGTGAIDVPQGSPSVHKGKCVQCHMPPTGYGREGVGTAANHVFQIIQPMEALEARATVAPIAGASAQPMPMPYSACSKCHSRPGDEQAVWVQDTLTDRQDAMKAWDAQTTDFLNSAAAKLGFKPTPATSTEPEVMALTNANTALNSLQTGGYAWNSSQLSFQKAFTNQQYIESEGSWGIHNWDYARTIILKAQDEAKAVSAITVVTIKSSASSIKVNKKVTISGVVAVANSGTVTVQKKKGSGSWGKAATPTIGANGKYSAQIKLTSTGTFYFRVQLAASTTYNAATSAQVKVVVKK